MSRVADKRLDAGLCGRGSSYGRAYGAIGMQLAITAKVEQSKGRVAALLNLGDYEAGADRVNGAGRDDNRFARVDNLAMHEIDNRAVDDGRAKLWQRKRLIESERDFGTGRSGEHVPRFRLAMRQADRARERVIGMHLNGECLVGEEQLEQQVGFRRRRINPLEPKFTDRRPVPA